MTPEELAMVQKLADNAPSDGKTFGRARTCADGGPAFPVAENAVAGVRRILGAAPGSAGMTLRDYFAAAFVHGLLATDRTVDMAGEYPGKIIAAWAYALADAMLAERSKVRP